jgi:CRP/FNR family cyclic AMP-dependent transcriptional regulator
MPGRRVNLVIQEFLKQVSLFKDLDDDGLAQVLMGGFVKRYREGTVILAEGAPGGLLHVVRRGKVRISKVIPGVGEEALTILQPGEFFGEVEFLDGAPASANAIAHSACEVFSLPHTEIRSLMKSRPDLSARFLWAFAQTLAGRLRETDSKMAGLLSLARTL